MRNSLVTRYSLTMKCPYCESDNTSVIDTAHEATGPGIRRRRECNDCGKRFSTLERAILDTPMVVKSDGRREPFDRAKLMSSILSDKRKNVPLPEGLPPVELLPFESEFDTMSND